MKRGGTSRPLLCGAIRQRRLTLGKEAERATAGLRLGAESAQPLWEPLSLCVWVCVLFSLLPSFAGFDCARAVAVLTVPYHPYLLRCSHRCGTRGCATDGGHRVPFDHRSVLAYVCKAAEGGVAWRQVLRVQTDGDDADETEGGEASKARERCRFHVAVSPSLAKMD